MSDRLVIYKCPEHGQFITLVVEDESGCGTRIAGSKCCIRQYEKKLKSWPMELVDRGGELRHALGDAHEDRTCRVENPSANIWRA